MPAGADRDDPRALRAPSPRAGRWRARSGRGGWSRTASPGPRAEPQLGDRHHAGVVDEDVQRAVQRAANASTDSRSASSSQPTLVAPISVATRSPAVDVADRERDLGARAGQRAGGLDPDARRAAGDDRALAGEVDALDHLDGGRLEAEAVIVRPRRARRWRARPTAPSSRAGSRTRRGSCRACRAEEDAQRRLLGVDELEDRRARRLRVAGFGDARGERLVARARARRRRRPSARPGPPTGRTSRSL